MKELTTDLPKPMIPVGGIPVLERIVIGLASSGISQFCIITGYKEEVVRAHFGDGSRWNILITYARQGVQDGTGRVLRLAQDFIKNDPFLLVYGDILVSNETYKALQSLWQEKPTDGIIAVKLGEEIQKGGMVIFDDAFHMREIAEKATLVELEALRSRFGNFKPWYNAGIYAFTPMIFDYTSRLQKSARGEYELTDALRNMATDGRILRGHVISDYWVDVRDPEILDQVNQKFKAKS